jgi:hypothetical protein
MSPPNPPAHALESEIAISWLGDDGILYSVSKPPTRTIENVKGNIEVVKKITGGKKACILVFLCPSGKPTKATREYVAKVLPGVYKAMAMVSSSGLGRIIMNFIFRFNQPSIPMKTFSNEAEAKEWLKNYL